MNSLGGHTLDLLLEPLHALGGEYGYTTLLPLVFWSVDSRLGRRLYHLMMVNALVNGSLKTWWARPRPYEVDPARIVPFHTESSFGIPSGHTQGGAALGFFFVRQVRRTWLKVLLCLFVFVMGLSRMIMGVHFLQDVLAGWILGYLVVAVFLRLEAPLVARLGALPWGWLFLPAFIPAVLAILVDAAGSASYPVTKSLLATGGGYSGILLGMVLERKSGPYSAEGALWKRIVRFPVGLALLLGLNLGLSAAFYALTGDWNPSSGLASLYVLRYLIVGISGYWVIPLIFRLVRLSGGRP
jgi:hypothetical protein